MARIERFLPAGSKVTIQQPNSAAEWYTTRKDVTTPESPVTTECPLTGTEVLTLVQDSVRLYYHSRMTRGRVILDEGDVAPDAAESQFCLMHYDVPSSGDFPNPSGRLYPIAVRLTESAWLMRTGDIPYALMAEMQDAGCTVEVNNFDKAESARLIRQAVGTLQKELADACERANEAMERATDCLAAQGTEANTRTPEEAERFFLNRSKAIERRLATLQKQVTESATRFGIRPQAINLTRLGETAQAVRTEMTERARLYKESQVALAALGTVDGTALATLAAQSQVPAEVMAGALEDAGNHEAAQALMAAFHPAEETTFSLADVDDEAA